MKKLVLIAAVLCVAAAVGAPMVSAHEVYVLNSGQISQAMDAPSFSLYSVAADNLGQFSFWAFIGVLTVFGVFWISTLRFLERRLDPILTRARRYAPAVARVTLGLSFLAAAYYQATYGPELPLAQGFGPYADAVTAILVAMGLMVIAGFYTRVAAAAGVALFAVAVWENGWYMLTYANYLGELIVLLILGAHSISVDRRSTKQRGKVAAYLAPRSFAILRVFFGTALMYASFYAKVLHNDLALMTVQQYHLDKILGFEPHFLVMGAAIIELLIGIFFILGIEIRFTSLFMLFWLTLSLIFFGEVVWPHLILIGIPIAYVMYGYDRYSVEGYFFRKKKYEPVL